MPAATARPRGRPAWSSATSPDSPPRSAKKALARATAPPAWQTPAMRLAEAQKRASSATGAGDHREALKWHLRALALAKVHVAAVTAAGGRLSREEATAAARTHMAIAETYEASKGLGLAFSGAGTTTGDGDEENARGTDVLRVLDREASDMAGLTQAVTHLQHAIGACATTSASVSGGPSCEFSEQNARALRETKLEARARLGPRLLAVGRAEDAAETTRRALEAMGSFRDSETESSATEPSASETSPRVSARRENRNAKEIETRLALLLCAADAERTVGERFASRARGLRLRARARAAAVASAAADLESSAAEPSARVSGRSGRSGDEVYAEKARLARAAADEADAGEKERRDAEAQASQRFSASEARLVEAERLGVGPFAVGPFAEGSPGTAFAAAALTRRRSLCRARRDWRGAAACVTEMLALAEANGGALPGTSHAAAGSAAGALRAEAAELFVRAKAFGDAEAHAAAAAEALRDPVTRKHTAASVRASGTHAFITARLGDLEGAAQMYRDARAAALAESAFGAATEASADLADLEAALGSVRFAMSEARGDDERRRPAKGAEEGEDAGEEPETSGTDRKTSSSSSEDAEAAARGAARRRRLAAVAALEEALGCFARAADIERALGGAYSARCVELEDRADACATALAEERAEGEDGAPFL